MALLRAVGRAAVAVVGTVVGLVLIVVPWAWQKVGRGDPVHDRPGWQRRLRRPQRPASRRTTRVHARDRDAGRWLRRGGAVAVVVGLVVWLTPQGETVAERLVGAPAVERNGFGLGPTEADLANADDMAILEEPVDPNLQAYRPDPDQAASMRGQTWWREPDYVEPIEWLFTQPAWLPVSPYRFPDVRSKYIDVEHGYRQGWEPPPCGCRRLKVWVYGGSTTWGLDQRGDRTISSYLSKVAAEDGLTVDVSNRGQMGHLHWMEAERFAWDLTQEDPPDVVVFYDGFNDTWSANVLNELKSEDIRPIFDPTLRDVWNASERSEGTAPDGPPGSRLIGAARGEQMGSSEFAATVVARYDRSRLVSKAEAASHGVTAIYFWQPDRMSRPVVMSEPHDNAETENWTRLRQQQIRAVLPDDVIDLSDVFDDHTEPLFADEVHHNEAGAKIVAESMYAAIEGELRAALEDDG